MLSPYVVIFLFVAAGVAFGAGALIAAKLLRPSLPYARKLTTYECGIKPTGSSEVKLNIRFYVFALLFVVFDVEILYVYPWAVTVKEVGPLALAEMAVFLAILFIGLIFAWRKGALVWE
ncbi:MAG: NADH-quinone oxidoreductase subunit A [Elusimicrobia bacterium]|nr:NADH-quinone oxidoreductase subunit A [Elusimicrobiota bacterium]